MSRPDIIKILNDVIHPDFINQSRGGPITIKEIKSRISDSSAPGEAITLKKTGKVFVFSLDNDEVNPVFPFFNSRTPGICKVNDGIVIWRRLPCNRTYYIDSFLRS